MTATTPVDRGEGAVQPQFLSSCVVFLLQDAASDPTKRPKTLSYKIRSKGLLCETTENGNEPNWRTSNHRK